MGLQKQLILMACFGFLSSAYRSKYQKTTLSESEQRSAWIEEFEYLKSVTRHKVVEEYFRELEEERERTRNTPEIDIYSPSAERRYWWDSLDDAPDYPDYPEIKAGMFTGTTPTWPDEITKGTTERTTFRFTKFKHKIPSRLISNRRRTEEPAN